VFRQRLSQLECKPVTAQLRLAEVQTLLSQVVEDSMEELLGRIARSNSSGSGPTSSKPKDTFTVSTSDQLLESDEVDDFGASSPGDTDKLEISSPASPSINVSTLLDPGLGVSEVDDDILFSVDVLGTSQIEDYSQGPGQLDYLESLNSRPVNVDSSLSSQRHWDQSGTSVVANVGPNACFGNVQPGQPDYEGLGTITTQQISAGLPLDELFLPETFSNIDVPNAFGSMGPPPARATQSSHDSTLIAHPLQSKRSQRSLDSGYESMLTAQQSHISPNNSVENLTHLDTGFSDTIAESWGPTSAGEGAFCEQAKPSAKTSYFSESRNVDYPSVTY
jgi:hypothetical protein